ncbi:hypothetical protein EXE48_14370 [Halorubrum sp. ASP1]|uniref:hypothetical protein n=1 Tax=Halorubrum sp. ASP1 TaxID=2518114 RepID=UPI0010F477FC|nr:hypothetical protein [Halorubrum sp. ASP1]TKX59692.1 hypothetical protein EXE48_14370 [Halorubrum sp. ASP1]
MASTSPLNVEYWALQYSAQQDDTATYTNVIRDRTDALERARALWDWKDLSRGVDIDDVTDVLTTDELIDLLEDSPGDAVGKLADLLVERGALANRTVVTPAFLLHLADSGPVQYSVRFPIFDVRCWVAYVYLTRRRDGEQPLPASATQSPTRFGEFSEFFQRTIPEHIDGRRYEQAIFRFGAYISAIPFDTISEIDGHLNELENAITSVYESSGFALTSDSARGFEY